MPHIALEYSATMERHTDIAALCDHLRKAAISTGVFPMPGIRVRAIRADHVSIADGDDRHGFIDISVRLREGRDLNTRKAATHTIFEAAERFLQPAMAQHSIALSLEMRNIDAALSPKSSTIRDHLKEEG